MADELGVDSLELKEHSDAMFSAMRDAAADFVSHEAQLDEAQSGWIGPPGRRWRR
jgi:hypothetical protein